MKRILSLLNSLSIKKLITRKDSPNTFITIDFPKTGERIHPQHYAICIRAHEGDNVQLSINQGDWKPCHFARGFYWFDWHNIPNGKHEIVAKMMLPTGGFKKSNNVKIIV